ncbi:hypothetical protein [Chitinivibrio alkaliphilus]|uniref:Uncharacterized protein n=1 Tax=Chitinivibrio alkaliphilus ACht1 TaxID=1313304 RepID=U7D5T8_9BACT|nr:hypothetical protein [Chitinivibrio alkaliphilus]ERP31859.1 hypothetical protein CALK_1310 [Chitinivibrio alkaliphilus ACht1]
MSRTLATIIEEIQLLTEEFYTNGAEAQAFQRVVPLLDEAQEILHALHHEPSLTNYYEWLHNILLLLQDALDFDDWIKITDLISFELREFFLTCHSRGILCDPE